MSKNFASFETERLLLKPTSLDDADFIYELMNTPKWIEYIGDRNIKNITDARQYIIDRHLPNFEKYKFGSYTVVLKSNQKKIGSVGIYQRDVLDVPDIGFAFLPEFEGKGFGFEAAKKIMDLAKTDFGLTRLAAITLPSNKASQQLIEKLGLHHKKMIQLSGDDEELMYYEVKL